MKIKRTVEVKVELDEADSRKLLKAAESYNEHKWYIGQAVTGKVILSTMTDLVNRAFEQGRQYERNQKH